MWEGQRDWFAREVVARGLASPADLERVHWVRDTDQALAIVAAARDRFLARHEVSLPPTAGPPAEAHGDDPAVEPSEPLPAVSDRSER
jgi:hypothetical protein